MNRRDLLSAAVAAVPAASVTAIGAALASGNVNAAVAEIITYDAPETPIMALYREFYRLSDAADAFYDAGTGVEGFAEDELLDRLFYNERDEIEARLMALPCQTPGDFAAKVAIATCRGGLCLDWDFDPLWIEARALMGGGA